MLLLGRVRGNARIYRGSKAREPLPTNNPIRIADNRPIMAERRKMGTLSRPLFRYTRALTAVMAGLLCFGAVPSLAQTPTQSGYPFVSLIDETCGGGTALELQKLYRRIVVEHASSESESVIADSRTLIKRSWTCSMEAQVRCDVAALPCSRNAEDATIFLLTYGSMGQTALVNGLSDSGSAQFEDAIIEQVRGATVLCNYPSITNDGRLYTEARKTLTFILNWVSKIAGTYPSPSPLESFLPDLRACASTLGVAVTF